MTLLRVTNLAKSWGGVRALRGLSFTLAPAEMLALIGPNGAGKSTAFACIGGQTRPDAGQVTLDNTPITGLPARALWQRGIGRTFQITASFSSMTVRENIQTALLARHGEAWSLWRAARSAHTPEADALLARCGLAGQENRAASVLAYGDLKRLELAIALAGQPRLLLMDEPTAGMAPAERLALMALVRGLATERGLAVLFTEHDMDVVFGTADRVLVLDRGQLIAEGTTTAIRADARVRSVYLGSAA